MARLDGNPHQAALNILREEWRAVRDIHRDVLSDERLRREDHDNWRAAAEQSLADRDGLGRTIQLLERIGSGQLVEVGAVEGLTPTYGDWSEVPPKRLVQTAKCGVTA